MDRIKSSPFNHSFVYSDRLTKTRAFLINSSVFAVVVLSIQNLVIFFNHYFHDYGFPWDFPYGFYPVVSFWVSLASRGYFPTWIPYTQMGLPMDLALQTGIHYPLFYIIPLLKIEYNFHTAVVFQTLHVLLGAVGMFVFLRKSLKSNAYALVGAFAFQFFGGFYSNAEHSDIIRAFALTPWLFYVVHIDADLKLHARHLGIPLVALLFATGTYPGNLIATGVIMAFYVPAQWAAFYLQGAQPRKILRNAIWILGLVALGAGLAFFHLAPGFLYQGYMYRSDAVLVYLGLGPEFLPGLFLNNNVFNSEISMTSTFITLPVFMLCAFCSARALKQWWPMAGSGVLAALMVAGPESGFWHLVTALVHTLKLSRFPASDYRVFVAFPLIFFALLGLKALTEQEFTPGQFLTRLGVMVFIVCQMIYRAYYAQSLKIGWWDLQDVVGTLSVLALAAALFALIFFRLGRGAWLSGASLPLLMALIAWNAYQVLPNMKTWQLENISNEYAKRGWPLVENGRVMTPAWLMDWPEQRPARITKKSKMDFTWEGYVTGRYVLQDKVPYVLKASHLVDAEPAYRNFMARAWMPLFFDPQKVNPSRTQVPVAQIKAKVLAFDPNSYLSVHQTQYGINTIRYQISTTRPTTLVENEVYFPGWTAKLYQDGKPVADLKAFALNGLFRAWELPAGNYEMVASFEFPHIWLFRGISFAALLVYLATIGGFAWLSRRSPDFVNAAVTPEPAPVVVE